ncbi:hypothetical protein LUZ60_009705 [Juncus effusus]|nr:hypothetical protein LUZ60_009705 [Juncus effusus]
MSFNQWMVSDQDSVTNSRKTKILYMAISFTVGFITFLVYMFVWYLCTRQRRNSNRVGALQLTDTGGISKAALAALPINVYKHAITSTDTSNNTSLDCAVCLAQVQGGEKVRKLPKCKHLFHVECIDMWLYSHSTCPICRCDVRSDVSTEKKKGETSRVGAVPAPIPVMVAALPPV